MGSTVEADDMIESDIVSIARHYDLERQELKLIEEMGELADAIGDGEESHIVEESADVILVLLETMVQRGCVDGMFACMAWKAKRTLMRIDAEEADGR